MRGNAQKNPKKRPFWPLKHPNDNVILKAIDLKFRTHASRDVSPNRYYVFFLFLFFKNYVEKKTTKKAIKCTYNFIVFPNFHKYEMAVL